MILNMLLDSIGISLIDENLQKLLQEMSKFPESSILGTIQGWAKIIGLSIALGVGSYECYMMILGRRGMDVMKLLRIIIISICITSSSWICEAAAEPGKALADKAQELVLTQNQEVTNLEEEVSNLQTAYLSKIDSIINNAKIEEKTAEELNSSQNKEETFLEYIGLDVDEFVDNLNFRLKALAVAIEAKITEWIEAVIRFIAEIFFQIVFYALILAQTIFMHLLGAFCPIAFAMSLAPPYKSAWSQWLSKYLSLSLWSFIAYMIFYYASYIMLFSLNLDKEGYNELIGDNLKNADWTNVITVGMNGLGTTCMYVVGLMVAVYIFKFVPEVASWLIPGGVSSGVGGTAGGIIQSTTGTARQAGSDTRQVVSDAKTAGKTVVLPMVQAAKEIIT